MQTSDRRAMPDAIEASISAIATSAARPASQPT